MTKPEGSVWIAGSKPTAQAAFLAHSKLPEVGAGRAARHPASGQGPSQAGNALVLIDTRERSETVARDKLVNKIASHHASLASSRVRAIQRFELSVLGEGTVRTPQQGRCNATGELQTLCGNWCGRQSGVSELSILSPSTWPHSSLQMTEVSERTVSLGSLVLCAVLRWSSWARLPGTRPRTRRRKPQGRSLPHLHCPGPLLPRQSTHPTVFDAMEHSQSAGSRNRREHGVPPSASSPGGRWQSRTKSSTTLPCLTTSIGSKWSSKFSTPFGGSQSWIPSHESKARPSSRSTSLPALLSGTTRRTGCRRSNSTVVIPGPTKGNVVPETTSSQLEGSMNSRNSSDPGVFQHQSFHVPSHTPR